MEFRSIQLEMHNVSQVPAVLKSMREKTHVSGRSAWFVSEVTGYGRDQQFNVNSTSKDADSSHNPPSAAADVAGEDEEQTVRNSPSRRW